MLLAVLAFSGRGLYRGFTNLGTNDFFGTYTISKAWLRGAEPYSNSVFVSTWEESSGHRMGKFTLPLASYYNALPTSVPLVSPLAALPWRVAVRLWTAVSVTVFLLGLWLLALNVEPQFRLFFVSSVLLLGPVHTGLASCNATPLLVGLLAISFHFHQSGRVVWAGVMLGVVGCFKPHLAGAMVLLLLAAKAWKALGCAIATGVLTFVVFLLRTWIGSMSWVTGFLSRTRAFGAPGTPEDFSGANAARYELLNLQVAIADFTLSRHTVNLIAICIGLALVLGWFLMMRKTNPPALLAFAAINVTLLFPTYHRFYDATVLLFPLAWWYQTRSRSHMGLALLANITFFVPLPTAMLVLAAKLHWPEHFSSALVQFSWRLEVAVLCVLTFMLLRRMSTPKPVPIAHFDAARPAQAT